MPLWEFRVEVEPGAIGMLEAVIGEQPSPAWSIWDDRLTGQAWLSGYFESRASARAAWKSIAAMLVGRGTRRSPRLRCLPDAAWRDSYKRHFKPGRCGRLHWAPAWERKSYRPPQGDVVVWLDPGMAFGTGNHETTRLALERLVAFAADRATPDGSRRERSVIDVGCGSGILALGAARLGMKPVTGFDSDPAAVTVSRSNAELNGLSSGVRFHLADLPKGLSGRKAGLVLANIEADVLQRHASRLVAAVAPLGWLVLGGILSTEVARVRAAFSGAASYVSIDSKTLGEWSDLLLVRRS